MKKIIVFSAFSFGIAWLFWSPLFFLQKAAAPYATAIMSAGMFAPLIAALLTKLVLHDRSGLMLKPHIKGNVRHYLFALFFPAVAAAAGAAVYFSVFPGQFDAGLPAFKSALLSASPAAASLEGGAVTGLFIAQLAFAVLLAPFINAIFAFGEETGWRGYLLPALLEKLPRRGALIVCGVIWGLWHTPLIILGHNYGTGCAGYPLSGILAMCLFCICAGIVLCYLTAKTKSIWPAALAHGAINAVAGVGMYFLADASAADPLLGPAMTGALSLLPLAGAAVYCFIRFPSVLNNNENKSQEVFE